MVALGGTSSLRDSSLRGASLAARPRIDCTATTCVALTFDDGPSVDTPTLLNTLATNRIAATFFQGGQQVDAHPAPSRRAYVEGHLVANHTLYHAQLTMLTKAQQQWKVDVANLGLIWCREPCEHLHELPFIRSVPARPPAPLHGDSAPPDLTRA